jgi:hypothetical protein
MNVKVSFYLYKRERGSILERRKAHKWNIRYWSSKVGSKPNLSQGKRSNFLNERGKEKGAHQI